MKNTLLTALLLIVFLNLSAQTDNYLNELQNLADLSRLPLYRTGEIEQLSSYDRTGGNDDGFSGKYSFVRKEAEGLVIADLKGPGVISRIWTPTPEADTIKFYFDGEKKPRISLPFIDLFSGKSYPFVSPLCGYAIGGFYCFLPIPYEKSLKIVFTGKIFRFHQTEYRSLTDKEKMKSFSIEMIDSYQDAFKKIRAVWSMQQSPLEVYGDRLKVKKINLNLKSGTEVSIFDHQNGGRIVGIEFGAGSDLLQAYRKVMLNARWDNESKKALDLPLHDFFGFAFGKPAMQSILLGSNRTKLYSYLPMPFDHSAELKLKYDKVRPTDPDELLISGTIYYTEDQRDKNMEGKFYAQSGRVYNGAKAVPHTIADITGKGHYIGTILMAQGLEDGHTYFFEGDDIATIDGKMKFHGTGSEDYFNGGYYAVPDKWDTGFSLPIHGSLAYNQMTSRTGGYRFYLADKLNFDQSFRLTIEHQPQDTENVKTDYTSIGMFYAENPQYENSEIRIDDKFAKVSHLDKLTPQGMSFSLYWNATADYEEPAIVFGLKKTNEWFTSIDIEAIPIVQISLAGLDNGRYRLSVEYDQTENGSPFSIWQRSKQISGWIPTTIDTTDKRKTVYAGEIDITEEMKALTLRKKLNDNTSVRIYQFLFEKIENP
jgi:hypothetical protein